MYFNLKQLEKMISRKFGKIGEIVFAMLFYLFVIYAFFFLAENISKKIVSVHSWITERKNIISEQTKPELQYVVGKTQEEKDTAELLDLVTKTLNFSILERDHPTSFYVTSLKGKTIQVQNRHKLTMKLQELGIDRPTPEEEMHKNFKVHFYTFLVTLKANLELHGTYKKSKNIWKECVKVGEDTIKLVENPPPHLK